MSDEPTSKPLSGSEDVLSQPLNGGGGGSVVISHSKSNSNSDQQHITFDFFVNLSIDVASEDKICEAIAKSVDCDVKQISSMKIEDATSSGNKSRLRISGKVLTNDWEIPQLSQKFAKLVTDRILSGTLQELLELEERPRVSRFYSKSSTTHLPSINTISPTPYDQHDLQQQSQSSPKQQQQQVNSQPQPIDEKSSLKNNENFKSSSSSQNEQLQLNSNDSKKKK